MEGYFIVSENPNEKFDIKCELHPERAKEEVPEKQKALYCEMERANNIIKSLHNTKDGTKEKYFKKLLSLSQAGLVGNTAQPDLAFASLAELKAEMVLVEGRRIKNKYMLQLGVKVMISCILGWVLYFITKSFETIQPCSIYCLVMTGAFIGTWISFGARKFNITFEQLSLPEEDMMSQWIRLIYIGVCSAIFVLFLNTQVISIELGGLSTNMIKENPEMQMALGVLCGLVESKIGINIYKKATTLMSQEDSLL